MIKVLLATFVASVFAGNIVDLAASTPELSTFTSALKAGQLLDTLAGTGPFTVFAPTDRAFDHLPMALLDHLLDPANVNELQDALTYHVIPSIVHLKDLKQHDKIKTVEGGYLEIFMHSYNDTNHVYVDDAEVISPDMDASNGVIHMVDHVLFNPSFKSQPAFTPTIVDLAKATPALSTFVEALKAGNLLSEFAGTGPWTVFAPTNDAFEKLPEALLQFLLDPANIKDLDAVLTYHVVDGILHIKDLKHQDTIKTLEGDSMTILKSQIASHKVYINGVAQVIYADKDCTNGVVHLIDHVLIPHSASVSRIMKKGALRN